MKEQIQVSETGRKGISGGEVRVALTNRCNYRCSFCHHEGQQALRTDPASASAVLCMLKREISNGVNDVTLTGGEPLLERDLVANIVNGLAGFSPPSIPALTIVTNGALWDAGMISRLTAYPGDLKVNISLHTASPMLYDHITGTEGMRWRVIDTVRALVRAGVRVKINAVIMRGINSSPVAMTSLLMLARTLRVESVKFMELLCQPGDVQEEALFVGCKEIEGRLAELGYDRTAEIPRGAVLAHPSKPGFSVEVKRCSCALGCGLCRDVLGRNFGPDLKPHGCFWSDEAGTHAVACVHDAGARRVA